ncbi:MAG: hypothetical protein A3J50_02270 [Candidatus Woykebacteria bacterium RIFCSPHIGHO2_02_FULL_43_16b]|uniref:Big-1 domain-containing protein n=1 Tax=Candidatus Woykebacteria bacterium RIFCSPHIGHO2_02_FULL_43_16b TaxID=1802601 RepID=A0A1G1WMW4_9BACT|nr:MAG: hypothetical protein A3J50_02270 [Candidatus Woykebacteria bacterium RIFCSPHIGHO2_02_FULL_43_16b]
MKYRVIRRHLSIFLSLLIIFQSLSPSLNFEALAAASVSVATNGTSISADTVGGSYTALSGPAISEDVVGDIGTGTIIVTSPTGFEFDTSSNVTADVVPGASELRVNGATSQTVTPTSSIATFTVSTASSANPGALIFSGFKVRPTAGTPLASGNIYVATSSTSTISGLTEGSGGTSLGTLTEVAGSVTAYTVTEPATATAGSAFSTFVVTPKDQFGNSTTGSAAVNLTVEKTPYDGSALGTGSLSTTSVNTSSGAVTVASQSYNKAETIKVKASDGTRVSTLAATQEIVVSAAAVGVTTATGGSAISSDSFNNPASYTTLTGPAIVEAGVGGIGTGTVILNAPTGFAFDTTASSVTATVTGGNLTLSGGGSTQVVTPTSSTITITVNSISTNTASTVTFSGVKVKPTTATSGTTGNLLTTGSGATIIGVTHGTTNFGTLTQTVGALASYVVTAPTSAFTNTNFVMTVTPKDFNSNTRAGSATTTVTTTGAGTFSVPTINTSSGAVSVNNQRYSAAETITVGVNDTSKTGTAGNTTVFAGGTATINPATGGSSISADTTGGTYTSLSGPTFSENGTGSIGTGTLVIKPPTGFIFNTNSITASVLPSNTELRLNGATTQTVTATSASVTFDVTASSSTRAAAISISGLQVRPSAGTPLATGNIYLDTTSTSSVSGVTKGAAGTNFGTLTEVLGALDHYGLTAPTTGTVGSNFSVVVTPQDQFNNTRTGSATVTLSASGTSLTGVLGVTSADTSSGAVTISTQTYSRAQTITINATDGTKTGAAGNTTVVAAAALTSISNTLANAQVGQTTSHTVAFTTANPITTDGKVVITFPASFNVASAVVGTVSGIDGTLTPSVSGQVVTLTRSAGTSSAAGAKSVQLTGIVNHTVIGSYTVSVATTDSTNVGIDGPTTSSSFTLTAGPVSVSVSTVSATSNIIADNTATSTVTVTLKDSYSNAVSGKAISLQITAGLNNNTIGTTSGNGPTAIGTTDSSGVVTGTVKSTKAETKTVTAIDTTDTLTVTQTADIVFIAGPVSISTSTVGATSNIVADNTATSTVTVTLFDANSNPVSGKAVSLSVTGTSNTIGTTSGNGPTAIGTTNSSGVVTGTVKSTKAETKVVTATDTTDTLTITQTASPVFIAGAITKLVFTTTAQTLTAGSASAIYTVQTQDQYDNPSNVGVDTTVDLSSTSSTELFSTTSGFGATVTSVTISNSTNSANFYYKDNTAGTVTITADENPSASYTAATQAVTVNPASIYKFGTLFDTNSITTGGTATLTFVARDTYDNTVTSYTGDKNLTFSGANNSPDANVPTARDKNSADINFGTTTVVTFTNGTSAATAVKLYKVETANISVTDGTTSSNPALAVTVSVGAASKLAYSTQPSATVVAGVDLATQPVVQVQDAYGNVRTGDSATQVTIAAKLSSDGTTAGGGTLNGTLTVTASSGVVTYAGIDYTKAESIKLSATATSLTSALSTTIAVSNASVASFVVSGITDPHVAGIQTSPVVEALDAFLNRVLDFTGTVTFDTNSTDTFGTTVLPANYTFTTGSGNDNGTHTFTNGVTLTQTGNTTVRVRLVGTLTTEGKLENITVRNAAASQFAINTISDPQTAGSAFNVVVTAKDQYGNIATGTGEGIDYVSTVTLTTNSTGSGVSAAVLPTAYTFTTGDVGTHTFSVTLKKAESARTITATDNNSITATSNTFSVNPTTASQFSITGSSTQVAGASQNIAITALDAYNNTATSYTGAQSLTFSGASTATSGSVPTVGGTNFGSATSVTFTSGVVSSVAMVLYKTESAVISATATGVTTTTTLSVAVTPTTLASFTITGQPASSVAGVAFNAVATAQDTYQNTKTNYTGSVVLTSNDTQVVFSPTSPYTYLSGDSGVKTISVTYKTVGTRNFTVTDGAVTLTSGNTTVTPAAATTLSVSGVTTPQTAGASSSVVVTALDPYTNTDTNFASSVTITSSDANATLPAANTLSSGTRTFTGLVLKTVGTQSVTATGGSITGTQTSITVNPGTVTKLVVVLPGQTINPGAATITGTPTAQTAGVSFTATIRAVDDYYNTDTSSTVSTTVTSSDGAAVITPSGATALTAGTRTSTVENRTSGTTTTLSASATGPTTVVSTAYTVNHGTASVLAYTTQPSATGGSTVDTSLSTQPVVEVRDAYGNVATSATTSVSINPIRSNNSTAADGALTGTTTRTPTNGVVTFTGVGYTKTDTIHIQASATSFTTVNSTTDITLASGALANFAITGSSTQTAGASQNITITARDQYNNTATAVTGSQNLVFSGANAAPDTTTAKVTNNVSSDVAFGSSTALTFSSGVASSVPMKLYKVESAVIAATQSSITTTSTLAVTVSATTTNTFGVNTQNTQSEVAGVAFSVTVTAYDSYSNVATNYTGSHTLSLGWNATQGSASTFPVKPANGPQTFTSGAVTISGFTLVNPSETPVINISEASTSISGSTPSVTVSPGATTTLTVTPASTSQVAGTSFNVTIVAKDSVGNTVSAGTNNYTGTKSLVFSGPTSVSGNSPTAVDNTSANVVFGTATNITFSSGSATVSVNLKKAEAVAITVTQSALTGVTSSITVAPASTTNLVVSGISSSVASGTPASVTVTAKDSLGNTATNYTGTVAFTSSDSQATLPSNYAFTTTDAGVKTLSNSVTLKTVGTQSVTVTDTVTSSIAGSQTGISVTAGPLHHFTFTTPSTDFGTTVTANTGFSVVIQARDEAENLKSDFTSTVILTAKTGNNSTVVLNVSTNPSLSDTSYTTGSFVGGVITISDLRLGPGSGVQSPLITLKATASSDSTKIGQRVVQSTTSFAVGSVEGAQTETPTLLPAISDENPIVAFDDDQVRSAQDKLPSLEIIPNNIVAPFNALPLWAKALAGLGSLGALGIGSNWVLRRRSVFGKKFLELAMRLFTL